MEPLLRAKRQVTGSGRKARCEQQSAWATMLLLPSQHPPIIALTILNRQDPLGALGPAIGLFYHQGLPFEPFFIRQTKPNSTLSNDLCLPKMSAYNSVLEAQFHSARQIVNSGSWPGHECSDVQPGNCHPAASTCRAS
ncbi:hypothetical protein H1C71_001284 [Ictidomys tridecemlineatus]|nr:hypothetical protein H1C71_001284 [Ictidomys tridecemlineatus]